MSDEWTDDDYEIETGESDLGGILWANIGPVTISKDHLCTKDESCLQCGGTGYVLRPEAEWDSILDLLLLGIYRTFVVSDHPGGLYGIQILDGKHDMETGATTAEAKAEAIYQAQDQEK